LDLRSFLWYLFLTAALSFKKGFSTRTLSEFGREPLLLVLKFQLNVGHPRGQLFATGNPVNETWVLTTANGISGSQLQINSITPNRGGNAGVVSATITGTGFQ